MIVRLIAHKITKEAKQTKVATITKRASLIDSDSEAANHLYTAVKKTVNNRGATGKFSRQADGKNPSSYEGWTKDYIAKQNDESFLDYSLKTTEGLCEEIKKSPASTGGYLVCIHYQMGKKAKAKDSILIALISEKGMPVFDSKLDLNEENILDLANLKHCVRVRTEHLDRNTDQVVQFLSGRGDGEVSNYFKFFIGCTNTTSSKDASMSLRKRLHDWSNTKGLTPNAKTDLFSKIYTYWSEHDCATNGLLVNKLADFLYSDENNAEEFLGFMTDEDEGIAGTLPPIKGKDMVHFRQFKYRSDSFTLQYDRNQWSDKVTYNEEAGSLVISDPPKALIDMLHNDTPS